MYPVKPTSFSVGVSDVIIADKVLASSPKIHTSKERYTLISVGSLEQMYKAPDVVLTAMSILKNKGFNLRLVWLGDGKFKEEMQSLAKELELAVEFKGNVSSDKVHANIDQSDMFILVSRTEGLPRAIVEAMAHGIPCIGSRVGGIPELLDDAALVDKENPEQLADLIERFITDHNFYNNQAVRNLNEASFYKEEKLDALRNTFFSYIKQQ
jgi:glycosyltransferase involved in cell wall biosynthesis